ncbi:hypothetical protein ABZ559_11255 [Streptococcus sp. ZY19097]|uniref:hypothetical protein n=1 Tax=Streptococcus sp. ZY19097 TaxID=3231906 RepID=UPI00345A9C25
MEEVIQSIVAVGGFGYLNYWLFVRIRDRDIGGESDRKFLIGLMSSFDYLIYLVFRHFCDSMLWSIVGAIISAIIFTISAHCFLDMAYNFSNWLRGKHGLAQQVDMHLWDMMFKEDKPNRFVIDFSGNIIASGVIKAINGNYEEKSLILASFVGHNDERPRTEAELMTYLDENDIQSDVYLNFDKKIKIIYF